MKASSKISQNNKFLEDNYFMEGDIKTISKQRTRFDDALKKPKKKPQPPAPRQPEPQPQPQPQPQAQPNPQPVKPASSGGGGSDSPLPSQKIVSDLVEKRKIYMRSVFREGGDIYDIQSRYVEYEHQIRKTRTSMQQLLDMPYPKEREDDQQKAVMGIYNELDIWEPIEKYNKSQGLTDLTNLDDVPIPEIQRDLGRIIQSKLPEEAERLMDQAQLQERGKSVLGEEHLPESMLQDQSFIRKKEQIRSLRSKKMEVIQKKAEEQAPEEVPQINVRPSSAYEEDIREVKEQSMKKIGDEEGEQVSQINVEEDSEIEYNLENINGEPNGRPAADLLGEPPENRDHPRNGPRVPGKLLALQERFERALPRKEVHDDAIEELGADQGAEEQPDSEKAETAGRAERAAREAGPQARGKHIAVAAGDESAEREPHSRERPERIQKRQKAEKQQNADRGNQAVGVIRKNQEYEHLKSKFDMINQAMKDKLMRNNHDLDNFRSGLNSDIGKSLSLLGRSRAPESGGDRNFMGEFKSLLRTGGVGAGDAGPEDVKQAHFK